jgi:hypothetical protein
VILGQFGNMRVRLAEVGSVLYGFWAVNYIASTVILCANLRRSSWRLPRSKGRQFRS